MTGPLGAAFITGLSDAQLLALEDFAEGLMIEILTQIADQYADKMLANAGLTAAADDAPPGAGVSPEDFAGIPADVSAAIGTSLIPVVAEVYQSGYGSVRSSMIKEINVSIPPVYSIDGLRYLQNMPRVFDEIGTEFWQNIQTELADGFALGESIPELANRVRSSAGTTARKATLIARSSVVGAANAGSFAGARASGLEMQKEWLATPDNRTRETHRTADGQRVELEGKFIVGGFEADHPGDITLPPQERYNCRCTQGYVAPRDVGPPREAEPLSIERPEGGQLPRPAPAGKAIDSSGWGGPIDPASKLTVTQLRELAKASGMQMATSGLRKSELIKAIRQWEIGNNRTVLPPMPEPAAAVLRPGEFVPDWDNPDPTVVQYWGGNWDVTIGTVDTGPGGMVIRDLAFPNGAKMEHGRVWRIDDIVYAIETPSEILSASDQLEVLRILKELRAAHAATPQAEKYVKVYEYFLEQSPADAHWAVVYKMPGFRSAATGGDGGIHLWDQTTIYNRIDPAIIRHETGHNVDYKYAEKLDRGSKSKSWQQAVEADSAANLNPAYRDLDSFSRGSHAIDPAIDHSKPYPGGVTVYGKSDRAEDFAESFDLYTRGVVGQAELPGLPGVRTDVFFRDIYPNRAAKFDELFPDFAKEQLDDIAARRAASAKFFGKRPDAEARALRDAARKQNTAATKASSANTVLSDLDEYVYQRADAGIFEARLQEAIAAKAITKAEADAIRKALVIGDAKRIRAALDRVGKKYGLTAQGAAGEVTTMADLGSISMRGTAAKWPAPGSEVRIIRRGAKWQYEDKIIDFEPMLVREITAADKAAARQAIIDNSTAVADLVAEVRAEIATNGGISSARLATLAGRKNLPDVIRVALSEAQLKGQEALTRALAAQLRAANVKAKGVVGRGVPFDPDAMEIRGGGALDPGTKVKIVETGYVSEIDGQSIVLRKAIVEPVAPKAPVTKIAKAKIKTVTEGSTTVLGDIETLVRGGKIVKIEDVGGFENVKIVIFADGRKLVRKDFKRLFEYTSEDLADSEMLGSLLAREMGLPAPRVFRDGPTRVWMDLIEGREASSIDLSERLVLINSDRGRQLGLFDSITANNDRNVGNWFVRDGGEIVPIDHAGIWSPGVIRRFHAGERGPFASVAKNFAERFMRSDASTGYIARWTDGGLDPKFIDAIRPGIEALRPAFKAAGREEWLDFTLAQLDDIRAASTARATTLVKHVDDLPRDESLTVSSTKTAKGTNPKFGSTSTVDAPKYRDAGMAYERWKPEMGPEPFGAYEENCSNVVHAFEMRMRGYDVEAGPLDVLDKYGYAAGRTYGELDNLITRAWHKPNGKPHKRTFSDQAWRSFDEIDDEIERTWPEGGRGFIFVGKHIFNVIKKNGKAQYIEAQFNANATRVVTALYKKKYKGSTILSETPEEGKLIRIDDLVPTDDVLETVAVTPKAALPAPSPGGLASTRNVRAPSNSTHYFGGDDPAGALKRDELRRIALDEADLPSLTPGMSKVDILAELRYWESATGRRVLPEIPDADRPAVRLLPEPDQGEIVGGFYQIKTDTGPGGIRVRAGSGDNGYAVNGLAWRVDDVNYVIELPKRPLSPREQTAVLNILDDLRTLHATIPGASKYNKNYVWVIRRNPHDSYWAKQYNMPGFESGATAGRGTVTVWNRGGFGPKARGIDGGTLRHETGHNLDRMNAGPKNLGSASKPWANAIESDAAIRPPAGMIDITGENIKPDRDITRAVPDGVSKYGQASLGEDFADAYAFYLYGWMGRMPDGRKIYFRDLFPARAAIFDRLLGGDFSPSGSP